jgi:hypothetical protein
MDNLSQQNDFQTIPIRLGNNDFYLKREIRSINDLKLDPSNQRITYKIRQKGVAVTDAELHKLLWELDSVKDLYQSIYQNGGLIEDPIIGKNNIVIEGNCRTVSLRELHKKDPADPRFAKLYVRVLPDNVTEEQLMMLLGELHIAGKIEWRAFEQAEYVWKMNKLFGKSYDFLAAHLRWSRSKLSQKIAAYEETKEYIERTGDPDGMNRFSHFEEFMKKAQLREKRENDQTFMKTFGDWILQKKFPDSKDVRQLPLIMDDKEAFNKFLNKGIHEAIMILHQTNPSLNSNLYSSIDSTINELKSVSIQEIESLKKMDKAKIEKIKNLKESIAAIEKYVGFNF